jgi:hypothetical protein
MKAPWLVLGERIGACSDRGAWCIYGEKFAEIAVMEFKRIGKSLYSKIRTQHLLQTCIRSLLCEEILF